LKALLRLGWMAASIAACVAVLAYAPGRLAAVRQAALEIGAAALPLLLMGAGIAPGGATAEASIQRSAGWIMFATTLFAGFVLTLGRGLRW
jgi:hypothetical protein